ncbi:MAG: hypothetical protein EOO51_03610 [Flavobacterium sp.]|nr:MAG: hypothetical protein EOO51_03610 [Flavobacterium sp.]
MENRNLSGDQSGNEKKSVPKKNQGVGDIKEQNEWHDHTDTDKYLALEQEGVTYTGDTQPTNYSDYPENGEQTPDTYHESGNNGRNADAFSQDNYILNDNIDLDEDQNQSISSDDR